MKNILSKGTAALRPLNNLGFNPKLSKLPQLLFMLNDLFPKVSAGNAEKLRHVAGICQQVRSLVGYRNNLFHRFTLNSNARLASQIISTNDYVHTPIPASTNDETGVNP